MTHPADPIVPEPSIERALWLPLERAADAQSCGSKALNLGRLMRAGLPVPPGFVLTVHALNDFLAATGLHERIAELERRHAGAEQTPHALEASVRTLFAATALPDAFVALLTQLRAQLGALGSVVVRSSALGEDGAHASFAGLMDSVLNVDSAPELESALKRVWASRWSARALAYSRARATRLGAIAVIVQRQVAARHSGVLFTRSPEPGRAHEMLCEYCSGLAQELVAGAITPARLRIEREALAVARAEAPAEADAPNAEQLDALASAGLAAERLFGAAQDIEWACDPAGRLWLVQSRPIIAGTARSERRRVVWSNANVNENFPAPISPLLYSLVAPGYSAYFTNLGRAFGIARWRMRRMRDDLDAIVGVHGGRLYYNLTAIHAVLRQAPFGEHLVAWFDQFTGADDAASTDGKRGSGFGLFWHDDAATAPSATPPPARRLWRSRLRDLRILRSGAELIWVGIKTAWQYVFIERRVMRFERCIDVFAARSAPQRLGVLNTLHLRDLLRGFMRIRLERWTDAALADAAAMVCYGALKTAVAHALAGEDEASVHNDLLKGLTGLKSAEPVNELWALAHAVRSDTRLSALFETASAAEIDARVAVEPAHASFDRMLRSYLERWGFRCSGELMLTQPSFQEHPHALLEIVRAHARQEDASPRVRLARQQIERHATTQRVLARAAQRRYLGHLPWPNHATLLRPLLRATQAAIGLRERARLKQALLYNRLRRIALETGERLVHSGALPGRDDVFFLTLPELDQLLSGRAMFPNDCARLVELRRDAHARFGAHTPPDVLIAREGDYPDGLAPAGAVEGALKGAVEGAVEGAGTRLHGTSVCGGVATGRAKVLTDVAQTHQLAPGDVLVTRQTDPGWAPAFVQIGALVLERGGMLSHGAILAREYGIPTIVGIAGATERIAHGASVRVDADHGDVHILA